MCSIEELSLSILIEGFTRIFSLEVDRFAVARFPSCAARFRMFNDSGRLELFKNTA